ncbi:hypothetical protein Hanom_Chr07g00643381 [Helianthus anomalus]
MFLHNNYFNQFVLLDIGSFILATIFNLHFPIHHPLLSAFSFCMVKVGGCICSTLVLIRWSLYMVVYAYISSLER